MVIIIKMFVKTVYYTVYNIVRISFQHFNIIHGIARRDPYLNLPKDLLVALIQIGAMHSQSGINNLCMPISSALVFLQVSYQRPICI